MFKPFDPEVLRSKVAVFVDLYEKTQRLQESEERFRAAFAERADRHRAGRHRRPLDAGEPGAVRRSLGRAQSELIGERFDDRARAGATAPPTREATRADARAASATRYQAERRYLHKDGLPVDVLVSVSLAPRRRRQAAATSSSRCWT